MRREPAFWDGSDAANGNRAVTALALGIVVALLGLVLPPVRWLYDYAWFVGFLVAGAAYVGLMQRAPSVVRDLLGEET